MTFVHAVRLFIFGVLAVCGALLMQLLFFMVPFFSQNALSQATTVTPSIVLTLLIIILSEEIIRAIMIVRYKQLFLLPAPLFSGVFFGSGFATIEVLSALNNPSISTHVLSLLGIILLHVALSTLLFFALRASHHGTARFFLCVFINICAHLLYNIVVFLR